MKDDITIPVFATDYDPKAEPQAPSLSAAKRDLRSSRRTLRRLQHRRESLISTLAETQIVREQIDSLRSSLTLTDLQNFIRAYRRKNNR